MATKYLEIINDNNSVVIDDNYACLELIDSFPLSQCTKINSGVSYYYRYPHSISGATLYGISLNGLNGISWFSFEADANNLYFYDVNSAKANIGIVSVARDDIISKASLYAFGIPNRKASTHGFGLEICNSDGDVVYTSEHKYLNVLGCGSDYTQSIALNGITMAFNLGYDRSCDYYDSHHSGKSGAEYTMRARFQIQNDTVSISRQMFSVIYVDFNNETAKYDDVERYFEAWLGYGWLIGNII